MPCFSPARVDLRLVVGTLAELIDNQNLIPSIADFIKTEVGVNAVQAYPSANSVQIMSGSLTLNITRDQTTLQSYDKALVRRIQPKLDRYTKEFLATVKLMQKIAALQQTQMILDDSVSASTGLRTLTVQV